MIYHPRLGALILPLTFLHPALAHYTSENTSGLHDNSRNCSCYALNSGSDSNSPEYFQYYRFWDFRNIADEPGQYTETPPQVNDTQDAGDESVWDSNILDSGAWNTDWGIQDWSKNATEDFPTRMVNSPANVYIQQNDNDDDAFTYLTLRTSRLEDFQSAAEIENEQKNLKHASMRVHARVIGDKGAVAGFFTFFDDSNESDIEILTDDPTDMIRYTNQPAVDKEGNEVAKASLNPDDLPAWNDWQTHRIDWLPKNSYWYLNDKQVAANTYSVPRKPSGLVLNMWSDGGEWSGNMSVGDSAEFQIQWIELVFNTSGPLEGPAGGTNKRRAVDLLEESIYDWTARHLEKRKTKGCEVVCRVDGVKELGTPEVVSVHKGMAMGMSVSWGVLAIAGVVSFVGI